MTEQLVLDWTITDAQWQQIAPHVPKQPVHRRGGARKLVDDRRVFEGMLWRLALQRRWNDIQTAEFASAHTCYRRHDDWHRSGALPSIWAAFLATLTPQLAQAWEQLVAEKGFAPPTRLDKPTRRELLRQAREQYRLWPERQKLELSDLSIPAPFFSEEVGFGYWAPGYVCPSCQRLT